MVSFPSKRRQNGTRCRDGVKVHVVVSFPSSLVVVFFRVPSLHALVFIQKTFLRLVYIVYLSQFFFTWLK